MLERIRIKGFQAHDSLDIQLDPRVTTIIGPTDAGKSSVLRAIRWLLLNEPRGKHFIRRGCKQAEVWGILDGHDIRRRRGKDNIYFLDGQTLAGFGSAVPEQIQEVTNVGPINFQTQRDPVFWLSSNPSQAATELNAVINLASIDQILGNLSRGVRTAKAAADVADATLVQATAAVAATADTPRMVADFEQLETINQQAADVAAKQARLAPIVAGLVQSRDRAVQLGDAALAARNVVEIGNRTRQVTNQMGALRELRAKAKRLPTKPPPDIRAAKATHDAVLENEYHTKRLAALIRGLKQAEEKTRTAAYAAGIAQAQLQEIGLCPTCGK